MDKNGTGFKPVGSQEYFGGVNEADGFGHGHINHDTGYIRPAIGGSSIENALGWTGVMGAASEQPGVLGKHNINIGK